MSVFKLPEIAAALKKGEKTIRLWCKAGRVSGAFQTAGGHWRIESPSIAEAVAGCNVDGFARVNVKRLNRAEFSARFDKTPAGRRFKRTLAKFEKRTHRLDHRLLMRAVDAIDLPEGALEELELSKEALLGVFELPIHDTKNRDAALTAALASWTIKAKRSGGKTSKAEICRIANLSLDRCGCGPIHRRSFERHFGSFYARAEAVANAYNRPADDAPLGFDEKSKLTASQYHSSLTAEEERRMSGARARKPNHSFGEDD